MPEWIADLLRVRRVTTTASRNGAPARTWQSVGSFGQRMKHVCESCNSGWMSDLETIAAPTLTRLILPRNPLSSIDPDEQLVIASWLWKVCVVLECATGSRYFNDAERRCLFDGPGEPPHRTVRMWMGVYVGRNVANLRGGPASFSHPDGGRIPGMLATLTAGLFCAQVLAVRPPPRISVNVTSRRDFTGAVKQVWPPENGRSMTWPPQFTLNHRELDLFHRRWNTPPRDE